MYESHNLWVMLLGLISDVTSISPSISVRCLEKEPSLSHPFIHSYTMFCSWNSSIHSVHTQILLLPPHKLAIGNHGRAQVTQQHFQKIVSSMEDIAAATKTRGSLFFKQSRERRLKSIFCIFLQHQHCSSSQDLRFLLQPRHPGSKHLELPMPNFFRLEICRCFYG